MGWASRVGLLLAAWAAVGASAQAGGNANATAEADTSDATAKADTSDATVKADTSDAAAAAAAESKKNAASAIEAAAKVADLTADVQRLSAQVKKLELEKAETISSLEAAAKEEQRKAAESAKAAQEAALKAAQTALGQIAELKKEISGQTKEIGDLKEANIAALKAKDSNIADLTERDESNTAAIDALTQRNATLSAQKDQLDKDLARVKEELNVKTIDKNEKDEEFDQLHHKHDVLEKSYEDLVERYSDPSLEHFLKRKAIKAYHHPGIEGAHNKTYIYILPSLRAGHRQGLDLLNSAHQVTEKEVIKLNAFASHQVGNNLEPYLPYVTGFLVYGMIGCPLVCSIWCLTRVICRIRPCLLFLHLYYALAALCAAVYAGVTGTDPFSAFAAHDAALYLAAQAGLCISLIIYTVFLLMVCGCGCTGYDCKLRAVQISGAVIVSIPYYELVWTPAMMDQLPKVMDLLVDLVGEDNATFMIPMPYGIAALIFAVLLFCEQMTIRHEKSKSPRSEGLAITMRADGELRGVEELTSFIGKRVEGGEVEMKEK